MVTNGDGVLIPKRMLRGVKEVEILKERGRIVVAAVPTSEDPIFRLGRHPVQSGVSDGAQRHDDYLYGRM